MPSSYTESVAAEIRAEMARQRITQRDLAASAGLTTAYLSRRLTGDVALSTEDIERLAGALGVPISELASPRLAAS